MNRIWKRAAFLVFLVAYLFCWFILSAAVCAVVFALAVPIFVLFGKEFLLNFTLDCFCLVVSFNEWTDRAGDYILK